LNKRIFADMKFIFLLNTFIILTFSLKAQISLLSTDFQTGIPSQFTILNNDANTPFSTMTEFIGQNAWIVLPDPENPNDTVAAATSYFENPDSADRWLITPQLTLSSFGNFISWNAKSHDPSFPDDYLVLVSTTDNQLASFTDTIGSVEQENFEWTNREVNLSDLGYNDSTIYVAFVLRTYDGFKLYLDDIQVRSEDPVGLIEKQPIQITIYPNPTSDNIQINSEFPIENIKLFSMNGQLLKTTNNSFLNISELSSGSYLVQVTTSKGIVCKRVTKVN
jgi:hypothetical protein